MTAGAKKNGCNNSRKIVITAHSQHQNTWQHEGYRSHPCSQQAMAGATSSPSQLQQLFSCCKVQSYSVWHSSAQIHICSLPPWCKLNSTVTPSPDWEWQPLLKWTWVDFQKNVTFNWVSKRFQFLSWSTAAIHNRNKWCIVLPFIRQQFWVGWGGNKRTRRGSSVHHPIVWGSVFPHNVNRDCQCHGHTLFLMLNSALCRCAFSIFNPQCSFLNITFTLLGIYPGLTQGFLQQPSQPKQWHKNPRKSFTNSYLIKQPFK